MRMKMTMKVQQIKTVATKDERRCGDRGCVATTVTSVPESLLRQSVSAAVQPAAEERHLRAGKGERANDRGASPEDTQSAKTTYSRISKRKTSINTSLEQALLLHLFGSSLDDMTRNSVHLLYHVFPTGGTVTPMNLASTSVAVTNITQANGHHLELIH